MGPLINCRHEIFAQNYVSGKTAIESAKIAGYRNNDNLSKNAHKLLKNPEVLKRVIELQTLIEKMFIEKEAKKLENKW